MPGPFPEPIAFASQRDFVRRTLRDEAGLRRAGTQFVDKAGESAASQAYRRDMNADGSPSEAVAAGYRWMPDTELAHRTGIAAGMLH